MFQVYTYFGRVLATFPIGTNELHFVALDKALQFMSNCTAKQCWIRYIK